MPFMPILRDIVPTTPLQLVAWVLICIMVLVIIVVLGPLPYKLARSRNHPEAIAIGVTNLSAIFFLPSWLIAFIWVFSHARQSTANYEQAQAPQQPSPSPSPQQRPRNEEMNASPATTTVSPTATMWGHSPQSIADAKAADPGPGGYLILGIDTATQQDVELIIDARSQTNAKVKAELQGITVTSCTLRYALS